jgi:hypothetical protein
LSFLRQNLGICFWKMCLPIVNSTKFANILKVFTKFFISNSWGKKNPKNPLQMNVQTKPVLRYTQKDKGWFLDVVKVKHTNTKESNMFAFMQMGVVNETADSSSLRGVQSKQ